MQVLSLRASNHRNASASVLAFSRWHAFRTSVRTAPSWESNRSEAPTPPRRSHPTQTLPWAFSTIGRTRYSLELASGLPSAATSFRTQSALPVAACPPPGAPLIAVATLSGWTGWTVSRVPDSHNFWWAGSAASIRIHAHCVPQTASISLANLRREAGIFTPAEIDSHQSTRWTQPDASKWTPSVSFGRRRSSNLPICLHIRSHKPTLPVGALQNLKNSLTAQLQHHHLGHTVRSALKVTFERRDGFHP
jgi:hypothetical protein